MRDIFDIKCVKCASENIYKNSFISEKQRYKCKDCGYNFKSEQCFSVKLDQKFW